MVFQQEGLSVGVSVGFPQLVCLGPFRSSGQIAIKLGSDNDEHRKDFCDPPDHQDRNFPLNNTHLILNTGRDGSGVKLLI